MSAPADLHALPIAARPSRTWAQIVNMILCSCTFLTGCIAINASQFILLLPLKLLPFQWAQRVYAEGVRYSKGSFGTLIVLMTQWFAPTTLVVSFERDGPGSFTDSEIENIVERDDKGNVAALHLPQKTVLIANHQIYADWWYAWCLTYFTRTHKDVFIVLKKSLKWVPILGWGMQFFNFIFLARSWAADRSYLTSQLAWLGRRAEEKDTPLTFILYPEGTLVSGDTKPISKKYADKLGIPDMMHSLLPRSTGLQHTLRALAPRMPSLQLIDLTVAYPGIPPFGYGQDYYTLRSIFFDRVPPPAVHIHIRRFDIAREVPIGNGFHKANGVNGNASKTHIPEVDIPADEHQEFDEWLREIWRGKDALLEHYLKTGSFVDRPEETTLQIPIALRRRREVLDAFCFFVPAIAGWVHPEQE